MALSTRKKNTIIAEHKAGKYKTKTELAKAHKVDRKTLYKILQNVNTTNADIVEVGVQYETAKKATRNPHEIRAIEQAVIKRVNTIEIDNELVEGNRKNLKTLQANISLQAKLRRDKNGQIVSDLTSQEIKHLTGASKDIENIANPKDISTKVEVNQNNVVIMTDEQKREKINEIRERIRLAHGVSFD